MGSTPTVPAPAESEQQPGINVVQIYLDRLMFEHRDDSLTLPPTAQARVGDVNVMVEVGTAGERAEFGITRITVSTKPENDPVYNVQLAMVGVFARQPNVVNGMSLNTFLHNNSVALLYPFVRETLASITQKGRHGPVLLNPFNTRARWKTVVTSQEAATGETISAKTPAGRVVEITETTPPKGWDRSWRVEVEGGYQLHYVATGRSRLGSDDPARTLDLLLEDIDRTMVSPTHPPLQPGVERTVEITLPEPR